MIVTPSMLLLFHFAAFFIDGWCYTVLRNGAVNSVVVDPDPKFDEKHDEDPLLDQDDDQLLKSSYGNRNAYDDNYFEWKEGIVPYTLDDDLSDNIRGAIFEAFEQFNKHTCIRFIRRRVGIDNDFVRFQDRGACFSNVGRVGGEQTVSLGAKCAQRATAMHEMMHALGFFHEHNRPDRDKFVRVEWNHIRPTKKQNFCVNDGSYCTYNNIIMPKGNTFDILYDYGSLMHYGDRYFTIDGMKTIIPKERNVRIGQRRGFSDYDLVKLNKMYDCYGYLDVEYKPSKNTTTTESTTKSTTTTTTTTTTASTTTTTTQPANCYDHNKKCKRWAAGGNCEAFPGKTLPLCKRSCGNCDGRKCMDTKSIYYNHVCPGTVALNTRVHCQNQLYIMLCPLTCGKCNLATGWHPKPYQ